MHIPMWLVMLTGALCAALLVWCVVGWLYIRTLMRALDAMRQVRKADAVLEVK